MLDLEKSFTSPGKQNFQDYKEIIAKLKSDPQFQIFLSQYNSRFYLTLGISDPIGWLRDNPDIYRGLNGYIDPQDETLTYAIINRKLRNQTSLDSREVDYVKAILISMNSIPSYSGIVFRGVSASQALMNSYIVGQPAVDFAFCSTSIDPEISQGFAKSDIDRTALLYVIKIKQGSPISAAHPGNNAEKEILLKPGQTFGVINKLMSPDGKQALIFMEQL